LDRTGREFRQLFAGKSTIGSWLYIAMESGCTIDETIGKYPHLVTGWSDIV
jgi:hypothetical protein